MAKQPKYTQNSLAGNDVQNNDQTQQEVLKYQIISIVLVGIIIVAFVIFFFGFWKCLVFGHRWQEASCETPQTCSVCDKTQASPLGHNWIPATYTSPKTCSVCGKTTGSALTKEETPAPTTVPATEPTTTPTTAPTEAPEETTQPTSDHSDIEEKIQNADLLVRPESIYDEPVLYTCVSKEGVLRSGHGTEYRQIGGALQGETVYVYAEKATPHGTWYFVENVRGKVGWAAFKMEKQTG